MVDAILTQLVKHLVSSSFDALSERHSVDVPYLLNKDVAEQFRRTVMIASRAFLDRTFSGIDTPEPVVEHVLSVYFESPFVAEEISKLLDPGMEIFDRGKLSENFVSLMEDIPECAISTDAVEDGWGEFLKAFSFASRSQPALREFLRASYEAGSFLAISNMSEALRRLDSELGLISDQEEILRGAMRNYETELMHYKEWAKEFRPNF